MIYQVIYQEEVVRKHIPDLSSTAKKIIKKAIEERLTTDPVRFGKPLQYSLKGHRRLRVGDDQVVYRIENHINTVVVIAIKHRKNVYED